MYGVMRLALRVEKPFRAWQTERATPFRELPFLFKRAAERSSSPPAFLLPID
jgi:hypothetical protein